MHKEWELSFVQQIYPGNYEVLLAPRHHHVIHLSCKNYTGFPFQSALNTKLHACASMLKMVVVLLTSLDFYISTLRLACFALLIPACSKSNNTNERLVAFTRYFGPYI